MRLGALMGLRAFGFATGLATAFACYLLLAPRLAPHQADCFAHFAYGLGEYLALLTALSAVETNRVTKAVHGITTLAWTVLVAGNCHLWLALLTPAGTAALPHPM